VTGAPGAPAWWLGMADVNVFSMETLLSIGIGLGLAAAAGFRVFVPLLVLSLAARGGHVPLSSGFEWIASTPALLAFATATVLEIGAYYVPWLDNLLDALAAPAAVVAGVVASASVMTDLPPMLKWSVAIVGGGAAAGVVQTSTSLLRLKSTATTAGLANPLVATTELVGSVTTSVLAIVLPILALTLIGLVLFVIYRVSRRLLKRTGPAPAA
jgi:Domain of unknown function (DUF4126)